MWEEMLAMRGVTLSYETVREGGLKFGQIYANGLRHKSPRPSDVWHLDEVFVSTADSCTSGVPWTAKASTTTRPQGGAQADAKTPEEAGRHASHHRD